MAKGNVKVIKVAYGIGGRPHEKNIEKTIAKWMDRGFRLDSQHEQPAGCFAPPQAGYTRLIFMKD